MTLPPWVAGAGIVGLLAGCWNHIKTFLFKIYSLIFITVELKGTACLGFLGLCNKKFKRIKLGKRIYHSSLLHVKPLGKRVCVTSELLISSDPQIFFVEKYRPILIQANLKKDEPESMSGSCQDISMTFMRWTINIDQILEEATDFYNQIVDKQTDRRRFFIRKFYGTVGQNRDSDSEAPESGETNSPFEEFFGHERRILKWKVIDVGHGSEEVKNVEENLILSDNSKQVYDRINKWVNSKDWYKEKRIPWKQGVLLYGKPGTGKTAFVRAVGEEFDLPIYVFYIATLSDAEFSRKWSQMLTHTPCIALIEDIDTVFHGRQNVATKFHQGLTFECLLNCIDGVEKEDGVLTIITTNNLEKLDEALGLPCMDRTNGMHISTRPGRVDIAVLLEEFTEDQRQQMADRILHEYPEEIQLAVQAGDGDTPAQCQDRCGQIALRRLWEDNRNEDALLSCLTSQTSRCTILDEESRENLLTSYEVHETVEKR